MDLTFLPLVLFVPILPSCWTFIRHSLCGQQNPCPKGAAPTSPKGRADKVSERKERPITRGYDDQAPGKSMDRLLQWQGTSISGGEGPSAILTSTPRLTEGATPVGADTDWAQASHAETLVDPTVGIWHSGAREEDLGKEADEFWTWCSETRSWYHKDDVTGKEIWAPFELD